MAKKKHEYTDDKIKTLSSLEHIRLRTGMYIGRTGSGAHYDDGIYILVKEVIDNGIDEFIMGHGDRIDVTIEDDLVTIRDYGRGIPLGSPPYTASPRLLCAQRRQSRQAGSEGVLLLIRRQARLRERLA